MSDRHCHITSFLHEDERVIGRFIAAAQSLDFFREVFPLRRGDRIRSVALFSQDMNGFDDESQMPEIAEKLSGILAQDIDIVSAWDGTYEHCVREHSWFIKGTGAYLAGEVLRDRGEIAAPGH